MKIVLDSLKALDVDEKDQGQDLAQKGQKGGVGKVEGEVGGEGEGVGEGGGGGWDRPHAIIGHSMSAALSMIFAATFPEHMNKLIM